MIIFMNDFAHMFFFLIWLAVGNFVAVWVVVIVNFNQ